MDVAVSQGACHGYEQVVAGGGGTQVRVILAPTR